MSRVNRRWLLCLVVLSALSPAGCAGLSRRAPDRAQEPTAPMNNADREQADLERELSLYSD